MISIIIPVYNQASKIGDCLKSLAKQTYQDIEIIIVNDGSTDEIGRVVAEFQKNNPELPLQLINQENQGANAARNKGASKAGGEYFLFSDADLVFKKEALAKFLESLHRNDWASYAYSSFMYGAKKFRLFPFSAERLREMPYIHSTSLMHAEDFPGFDPKLKRLQDWDLWLTMLEESHIGVFIDEVLFDVKTGGSISNWLPAFVYKLLPWLPSVQKYKAAEVIIKKKHNLM